MEKYAVKVFRSNAHRLWPACLPQPRINIASFKSTTAPRKAPRSKAGQSKASQTKAAKWPGFREETIEHRIIRENRLFNPFDPAESNTEWARAIRESTHSGTLPVRLTSTADIEKELIYLATKTELSSSKPMRLLQILKTDRKQQTGAIHYEALISLNALPDAGSVENLEKLLNEMSEQKITCDINIYTSLLRTLVVHPDTALLDRVLEDCASMWIELDAEMLHYVTAIYLRLGMLEIALDYLDRIEGISLSTTPLVNMASNTAQPKQAETWLYVLFIRDLAAKKDWEGVMRFCHRLEDDTSLGPMAMRQIDIPYEFWHEMLEMAVADEELWVTKWIWNTWVLRAWIRPSIWLCKQAMEIFTTGGLVHEVYSAQVILSTIYQETSESYQQKLDMSDPNLQIMHKQRQMSSMTTRRTGVIMETISAEERGTIASHWYLFRPDGRSAQFTTSELRINPWSMLAAKGYDIGQAWPQALEARKLASDSANETAKLERYALKRNDRAKLIADGMSVLPKELRWEIDAIAGLGLRLQRADLIDQNPLAMAPNLFVDSPDIDEWPQEWDASYGKD